MDMEKISFFCVVVRVSAYMFIEQRLALVDVFGTRISL
jgi:hypothetical protein